jgi:hypothetical protein
MTTAIAGLTGGFAWMAAIIRILFAVRKIDSP